MRRIYAIIGTILIILSFYIGYRTGHVKTDHSQEAVLNKRLDSLEREFTASKNRDKVYRQLLSEDSLELTQLRADMRSSEKRTTKIQKYYENKLLEITTHAQRDSFLTVRYPRPGVRVRDVSCCSGVEDEDDNGGPDKIRSTAGDTTRIGYSDKEPYPTGERTFEFDRSVTSELAGFQGAGDYSSGRKKGVKSKARYCYRGFEEKKATTQSYPCCRLSSGCWFGSTACFGLGQNGRSSVGGGGRSESFTLGGSGMLLNSSCKSPLPGIVVLAAG